ncbi:MAG: lactonase family protein [Chloroflexi bacterium]|nr:lactonase family protein [Chloroflexota bacterium]
MSDSLVEALVAGYGRRQLLQRAGAASAAFAGLSTVAGPSDRAVAQATPVSSDLTGGAGRFAYVGTYTRGAPGGGGALEPTGISIFAVEGGTGVLTCIQSVPTDNPSWLARHPTHRCLYAVN